jgi:hypothetical protein
VLFPLRWYDRPVFGAFRAVARAGSRHSYAQLTRFLPPSVRAAFDERAAAREAAPADAPAADATAGASIRKRLQDLWS